jgi:hypothetical protein
VNLVLVHGSYHAARERLGVEPVEIDGGHSPFITRPMELAGIIDSIVE